MNEFDFSPLQNAVQRLAEGLSRYQQDIQDLQIRDGLVQRFEFTYEISHKILKRYLTYISANPAEFEDMRFQDLIRTANEQDLLRGNWLDWKQYREIRSRTSHTYDEEIAVQVVAGIPKFLMEAEHLLKKLQERLNGIDD